MQWILVSERLPEHYPSTGNSKDVLLWDGALVQYGYYDHTSETWTALAYVGSDEYTVYQGITHWMPLPTPPKD